MRTDYALLDRPADDVVLLEHRRYAQRQLWAKCRVRGPRVKRCAVCEIVLKPSEVAFRPVGNYTNRAERICPRCIP